MAQDYFWLPIDTPFENMELKLLKIGQLVGHAELARVHQRLWLLKRLLL